MHTSTLLFDPLWIGKTLTQMKQQRHHTNRCYGLRRFNTSTIASQTFVQSKDKRIARSPNPTVGCGHPLTIQNAFRQSQIRTFVSYTGPRKPYHHGHNTKQNPTTIARRMDVLLLHLQKYCLFKPRFDTHRRLFNRLRAFFHVPTRVYTLFLRLY